MTDVHCSSHKASQCHQSDTLRGTHYGTDHSRAGWYQLAPLSPVCPGQRDDRITACPAIASEFVSVRADLVRTGTQIGSGNIQGRRHTTRVSTDTRDRALNGLSRCPAGTPAVDQATGLTHILAAVRAMGHGVRRRSACARSGGSSAARRAVSRSVRVQAHLHLGQHRGQPCAGPPTRHGRSRRSNGRGGTESRTVGSSRRPMGAGDCGTSVLHRWRERVV